VIQILNEVLKRVQNNETIALVTIVDISGSAPGMIGSKMAVNLNDGRIMGTIGGGILEAKLIDLAKKAIRNNESQLLKYHLTREEASLEKEVICGGDVKIFIDVIRPQEEMIIFGAGHIAVFLSKLAKMIGLKVTIVDERGEFANKERFPEADKIIISEPDKVLGRVKNTSSTNIVIITRGHLKDEEALLSVIDKKFRYIGMIGSIKKIETIFRNLREKGIDQEKINSVSSPIGIDIGAKTPEEIAISIIAEVIQVRRGKVRK
jgi:xanthine dehydrogenase accessory factor